jgi:hypothetical protein
MLVMVALFRTRLIISVKGVVGCVIFVVASIIGIVLASRAQSRATRSVVITA